MQSSSICLCVIRVRCLWARSLSVASVLCMWTLWTVLLNNCDSHRNGVSRRSDILFWLQRYGIKDGVQAMIQAHDAVNPTKASWSWLDWTLEWYFTIETIDQLSRCITPRQLSVLLSRQIRRYCRPYRQHRRDVSKLWTRIKTYVQMKCMSYRMISEVIATCYCMPFII